MSDTISRQAAIAYAISGSVRTLPTSEDGENWIRTEEVRQSLSTMPSAQPERKKGKWIEYNATGKKQLSGLMTECVGEEEHSQKTIHRILTSVGKRAVWQ